MVPLVLLLALAPDDASRPRLAAEAQPTPCPEIDRSADDNAYRRKVADAPFRRTGFVLGLSLGVGGCDTGDFCAGRGFWSRRAEQDGQQGEYALAPGPGPTLSLELGLRPIPYLEVTAFGQFTHHSTRLTAPAFFPAGDPFIATGAVGLGVSGRPLAFSRFDPHLGLALGYHQYRSVVDFTRGAGLRTRMGERLSRLLIQASVGLDVFVARQVALGPRFDYGFFAAGQFCDTLEQTQADGSVIDTGGCNDVSYLKAQSDPEGDRAAGSLPRFWRALVQMRVYL